MTTKKDNSDEKMEPKANANEATFQLPPDLQQAIEESEAYSRQELDFPGSTDEGFELNVIGEPDDVQDPDRSHSAYYRELQGILKQVLRDYPHPVRKHVRSRINCFCRDGKDTGRDVRQSYIRRYEEAVNIIVAWRSAYSGRNLSELLRIFDAHIETMQERQRTEARENE